MSRIGRHVVVDDLAFRHLVEVGLGVFVLQDLVDIDHVKGAIPKGDARRHLQASNDRLHGLAVVRDRINSAHAERADEKRALVAPRHLARAVHAGCIHVDLETLGQLDCLQVLFEVGHRCRQGRTGWRRKTLLRLGFVTEKPVRGRMFPEVFFGGVVALDCLSLGLGSRQHEERGAHARHTGHGTQTERPSDGTCH